MAERGKDWDSMDELQPVQMEAASHCSRCSREIPLLALGFLGPRYEAVCIHCAASQCGELVFAYDSLRSQIEAEVAHWRALADRLDVPEVIEAANAVANRLQAILDSKGERHA